MPFILLAMFVSQAISADESFDLVVYGGSSGGVAAAVQARRMGKTAVVIEPGKHLGGLTSGGLGATDIGNKAAIGGISREFYQRVKKHYADPANWKHERPENYRSGRQSEQAQEDAMWTFEPHVAERIFEEFCREAGVVVVKEERLDLRRGVVKESGRIVSIRMESGTVFSGRMFVDATYEGDLMKLAGVSYTVGREANAQYGETLNGVQTKNATKASIRGGRRSVCEEGGQVERPLAAGACGAAGGGRFGGQAGAGLQLPDVRHRCEGEPDSVQRAGGV
jgi:hypothetical protein